MSGYVSDLLEFLKKGKEKEKNVGVQNKSSGNFSYPDRGVKQTDTENLGVEKHNKDRDIDHIGGRKNLHQLEFVPERILKGLVISLLMLKGYSVYEEKQFSLQRIDVYAERGDEKLVIEVESSKKTYREGLRQLAHVYTELKDSAEYILVLPSASKKIIDEAEKLGFRVWTITDLVKEIKDLGIEDHNYVQILELGKMNIRDYILKTPDEKSLTKEQRMFKDFLAELISSLDKGVWIRKVVESKYNARRGNKTYQYIRKRISLPPDFPDKYAVVMRTRDFINLISSLSKLVGLPINEEKMRELFGE